jgi:hypothetical protein
MVPQTPIGQPTPPPQGKVYAQQNAPNPPIRIKIRTRGRERKITKTKGTRGIQTNNLIPMLGETNLVTTQGQGNNPQPKQGKNPNLCTNKPCTSCGVYRHYTHECPLLPEMHCMWEVVEMPSTANSQPTPPSSSQPLC